jgi:hypothetical protein
MNNNESISKQLLENISEFKIGMGFRTLEDTNRVKKGAIYLYTGRSWAGAFCFFSPTIEKVPYNHIHIRGVPVDLIPLSSETVNFETIPDPLYKMLDHLLYTEIEVSKPDQVQFIVANQIITNEGTIYFD